jgi:predicted DNA-binding protein (MmcQ/YjbR family)
MNIEFFREYCLALTGVTEELPFGPQTLVFKVYGKVFALTDLEQFQSVNLKCEPEKAMELRERYLAVLPGYHMNKKHWNTVLVDGSIPDKLFLAWVKESYDLVLAGVSKKDKPA